MGRADGSDEIAWHTYLQRGGGTSGRKDRQYVHTKNEHTVGCVAC